MLSLLVVAPFLTVLTSKFGFINPLLGKLLGGYKEISQVFIISVLFIGVIKNKRLSFNYYSTLLFFFAFYAILHVIGQVNLGLMFDGARYQLGYLVIFTLICIIPHAQERASINVDLLAKIVFIQTLIAVVVGVVEFFNPSIIGFLYGIDKDMMEHVTLAAGFRLISVFGNPINFGGFLCVGLAASYYLAVKKTKPLVWLAFWVYWIVLVFLVFFTLSRLALIAFFAQTILILMFNLFRREIVTKVFFITFLLVLMPFVFELLNSFDSLYERFFKLLSLETYTDNARVNNWFGALDNLHYFTNWLWGFGVGASNPALGSGGYMIENGFVSILIDFGLIGLTFYVAIWLLSFFIMFTIRKKLNNEFYFIFLFLVCFMLMSFGNDYNRNFPFVIYFWLVVSYLFTRANKYKGYQEC